MRRSLAVTLIVCAMLGLAGCGGGSSGSRGGQLEGVSWELVSFLAKNGTTQQAPQNADVTARFDAETVAGNAGCNAYSAAYTTSGGDLTVSDIVSTRMACPPPLDVVEQAYLDNLQAAAAYAADQEGLTIRNDAGDPVLTYRQRQDLPLTGTAWTMTAVNNGQGGVVSAVSGADVTLTLADDGTASGSSGCNQYSGTYTTNGASLSFGPLSSTQKACADPDLNAQEAAYFAALGTVASYRLEGIRLDLITSDGSVAASYLGAAGSSS